MSVNVGNSRRIISLLAILSTLALCTLTFGIATSYNVELFKVDESPFEIPYDQWVARYWNWWISTTAEEANPKENGCLMKHDGPVVYLMNSAVGGPRKQMCEVSSDKGILIDLWSGECDRGFNDEKQSSYEKLLQCARDVDRGTIIASATVDGIPVAQLEVVNDNTKIQSNVSEIYTKEFNVTIPLDSHYQSDNYGTFGAAAHGWFVFLKPLPPGDHTIFYKNFVRGSFNNAAEITYSLNVK